eukprot:11200127-Lingulodinium_polyedra.AAC.1
MSCLKASRGISPVTLRVVPPRLVTRAAFSSRPLARRWGPCSRMMPRLRSALCLHLRATLPFTA